MTIRFTKTVFEQAQKQASVLSKVCKGFISNPSKDYLFEPKHAEIVLEQPVDKGGSFFVVMKVSFDNRKGSWYAILKPAAPLEWDNQVFRLVADWETMEVVISSNALRAHIKWFNEWYKHPKFPEHLQAS